MTAMGFSKELRPRVSVNVVTYLKPRVIALAYHHVYGHCLCSMLCFSHVLTLRCLFDNVFNTIEKSFRFTVLSSGATHIFFHILRLCPPTESGKRGQKIVSNF